MRDYQFSNAYKPKSNIRNNKQSLRNQNLTSQTTNIEFIFRIRTMESNLEIIKHRIIQQTKKIGGLEKTFGLLFGPLWNASV
jgi:hypothetical protein